MSASLSGVYNLQSLTDLGLLAAGYRLYTYAAGTTTQKTAYTDSAGTVPHTYTSDGSGGQYIALNSRGELPAPLFLTSGGYDVALKTTAGVTVWTRRAVGQADDALTSLASSANGFGADLVGGVGRVVDTIAALKALLKTGAGRAFVLGYYTAGDGGGGQYYYDASDTTSADNGGTIIVASDGGRWKLTDRVIVSTRQFGVKADWNGSTGTDDTVAFQNALNWAQASTNSGMYGSESPWLGASKALYHPTGSAKITAALTATKPFALIGDGEPETSSGSRIVQVTNGTPHLVISPDSAGMSFSLKGIVFANQAASGTADSVIVNAPSSGPGANSVRILNCFFYKSQGYCIFVKQGDDLRIEGNTFDGVNASAGGGVRLGTTTSTEKVTNARIADNNFFGISVRGIALYNVDGVQIHGNRCYTDGSLVTNYFIDAINTVPKLVNNVSVCNNDLKYVSSVFSIDPSAGAARGITISNNRGDLMGIGAGETRHGIYLGPTISKVSIDGNDFRGDLDTKNFVNAQTNCTDVLIGPNNWTATGGMTGTCLALGGMTGMVSPANNFSGFATNLTAADRYALGYVLRKTITLTYGATVNTDASLGDDFIISATNGTAFTIADPTNSGVGQRVRYMLRNASGGVMGAITWGGAFKVGAGLTLPANGNSRCIEFRSDGTNWVEQYRSTVDVPN